MSECFLGSEQKHLNLPHDQQTDWQDWRLVQMLLVKSSQTCWQVTDLPEMFSTARIGGKNVAQGCCNNQKIFQTGWNFFCLEISMSSLWIGKQTTTPTSRGKRQNKYYNNAIGRQFHPKQLTLHSTYTFTFDQCLLFLVINSMTLALLALCLSYRKAWAEYCAYNIQCYITEKSFIWGVCKGKYYSEANFPISIIHIWLLYFAP